MNNAKNYSLPPCQICGKMPDFKVNNYGCEEGRVFIRLHHSCLAFSIHLEGATKNANEAEIVAPVVDTWLRLNAMKA
jgi:hypothetical protein